MRNARRLLATLVAALLLTLGAAAPTRAQEEAPADPSIEPLRQAFADALERIWAPTSLLTDGPRMRAAFREVVTDARPATVSVRAGGRQVALGGVVGPDGWVLTKATQLRRDYTVRLADGRELAARLTGVNRDYDLAMLKVDASGLPTLDLETPSRAVDGDWVATTGPGRDPVAVGVLSVSARAIPHRPGILGIQLEESEAGAVVVKVFPKTAAAEAGIKVNDVVRSVNQRPTATRTELIAAIRRYSPGDTLSLELKRGEQSVVVQATLTGDRQDMMPNRADYQNHLGSELSERRFGFPKALQHDSVLSARDCGGPLLDLDGRVIGFNLARAGRTETFAVPTDVVRSLLFDLMSGRMAPGEVTQADAP